MSNNKILVMMKNLNPLKNNVHKVLPVAGFLLLTSCGSFQGASYYDNDGIYSSSTLSDNSYERPVKDDNRSIYRDYFNYKAQEYEAIANENDSLYFTDIDNYSGTGDYDPNYESDYNSYAGWGDNTTDFSINIYNNNWGWNRWYRGYNYWNSGWWGWNDPWYWNSGFAWNGYYNPYWGGYYGIGWSHYYPSYYGMVWWEDTITIHTTITTEVTMWPTIQEDEAAIQL